MSLNKTTKYAIKVLEFMVQDTQQKYSATTLSQELNIPYKYLTKFMTILEKHDILKSSKGKYGGFSLGKEPSSIRLIDIIVVFDDPYNKVCVISDDKCNFKNKCTLHDKWQKPKCFVDDFYTTTTLADMIIIS